ncbi:hypothetical protein HNQ58_000262 [Rehaibacterium terrae]|uniref:Transposase n=1 Tax=Rehaibacterium terrae TaxID=1341696 RepID=A0A7W7XXP1_9GAMM|nr:hypothetical protein [Rehaibacterium terrae]
MSDALACGRRFRTFDIVDDFNREALHIEVDTSISSHRLVRGFEQIKASHGLPRQLPYRRAVPVWRARPLPGKYQCASVVRGQVQQ